MDGVKSKWEKVIWDGCRDWMDKWTSGPDTCNCDRQVDRAGSVGITGRLGLGSKVGKKKRKVTPDD